MSQRTRNLLQLIEEDVTTYHVSGTSCKLLEEAFTTYQEHLTSYLEQDECGKVAGSSCMLLEEAVPMYHVSGTPCKLLEEDVTTYHVSGTSCKLLEEAFTTYQEHMESYLEQDVATNVIHPAGPLNPAPCPHLCPCRSPVSPLVP